MASNVPETFPGKPNSLPYFAALSENAQYAQGYKDERESGRKGDHQVNLIRSHGIHKHPRLFIFSRRVLLSKRCCAWWSSCKKFEAQRQVFLFTAVNFYSIALGKKIRCICQEIVNFDVRFYLSTGYILSGRGMMSRATPSTPTSLPEPH
ncbi:hypothetical protein [Sorlinia euscelidii]|uniref:hypothetical protein n=1 Tax=Sorlinia euscelidii TaxID=3081148 RepID=UPI00374E17BA